MTRHALLQSFLAGLSCVYERCRSFAQSCSMLLLSNAWSTCFQEFDSALSISGRWPTDLLRCCLLLMELEERSGACLIKGKFACAFSEWVTKLAMQTLTVVLSIWYQHRYKKALLASHAVCNLMA